MHPSFQTPLTEELGCDYPVIQTAMGWVSTSQLVTASVEAGAFGFLAAAVMTPQECEKEIQFIKSQTKRPFGVNIHAFQPGVDKIVDMCIDYGVTALSYGRGPSAKIIEKVKELNAIENIYSVAKEVETIKSVFYKKSSDEKTASKTTSFLEESGIEEAFVCDQKTENNFKSAYNQFKRKKAEYRAQQEKAYASNLHIKKSIIEEIDSLTKG